MKKITTKTKALILIVILIVFLTIVTIFYFHKTPAQQQANIYKCPEAYAEDDAGAKEYRNALIDWTLLFFKANPKATTSDWSLAKLKLWWDNNCVVALERSKLSGKMSDLKKWELVDYEVQNGLDKAINNTN